VISKVGCNLMLMYDFTDKPSKYCYDINLNWTKHLPGTQRKVLGDS